METYRLSRIPIAFSVEDVKQLFPPADRSLIKEPISLANAIYDASDSGKVATVTFTRKPSFVQAKCDCRLEELVKSDHEEARSVHIDNWFDGLTPLLDADPGLPGVDIVASTGLGGRAFGSWQHTDGSMWLRDFLGRDIPGIRVFIWGQRSRLVDSKSHAGILDFRDNLLDDITKLRRSNSRKDRPLVLVGHSLGGLIIKAAFIKTSQENTLSGLYDIIHGLVFFGTPHAGIETEAWLDLFGDEPPQNLIRDLTPGSTILKEMNEAFGRTRQEIDIISCYERVETPTIRTNEKGTVSRDGEPRLMVTENSSCLNHPKEIRVVINFNHSEIAKLSNNDGSPYHTIVNYLRDMIENARKVVGSRVQKKRIVGILSGIRAFLNVTLNKSLHSGEGLLLLAEKSDIEAVCSIISEAETEILDKFSSQVLDSVEKLYNLFISSVITTSSYDPRLRKILGNIDATLWSGYNIPTWRGEVLDSNHFLDLAKEAIPLIIDLKESLALIVSDVGSEILKKFLLGPSVKHLGLDFVVRKQEFIQSSLSASPSPLSGRIEKQEARPAEHGLVFGNFFPKNTSPSESVILEYREYGLEQRRMLEQGSKPGRSIAEVKKGAQELATLLSQFAFNPEESGSVQQMLKPTMLVFDCMGYLEEEAKERLIFVYRIPRHPDIPTRTLRGHARTLKSWIAEGKKLDPCLEERYALAHSICHTVFNLHICGWVHKSIKPDNIVLLPQPRKFDGISYEGRSPYHFVPYLKGFEFSRKEYSMSNRLPTADADDIYRHPNRQQNPKEDFRQIHDLYAVGTILLEIGMAKSLQQLLRPIEKEIHLIHNPEVRADRIQKEFVERAEKDLPTKMGTRYSKCVIRCLEGEFETSYDTSDNVRTDLNLAFRRFVVDDLRRIASSCGVNA